MIDFLSISTSDFVLIFLLITVLVFFCLYIYNDNKKLKEQIEELRKENRSLLEKKILKQENIDSISIKNISTEKSNIDTNKILNQQIIEKEQISVQNQSSQEINNNLQQNFNLNEFINKKTIPTENNYDYLQALSEKINEELRPQTIELTDYEKRQEEQAVISYKELLKCKDNSSTLDSKQETINFIEELKRLRNSLK